MSRPRPLTLLALGLLLLVGLAGGYVLRLVGAAQLARQDAEAALVALAALRQSPTSPRIAHAAYAALDASARSTAVLGELLQPVAPLLGLGRALPDEVSWAADLPDLVDAASALQRAGRDLLEPLAASMPSSAAERRPLMEWLLALGGLAPQAPSAEAELERAERALARLSDRRLGGPLVRWDAPVRAARQMLPSARQLLELTAALGPALGTDRPRTYLLLGQNNRELRASGGFIGSMGVLVLDGGTVARLDYGSSYAVDDGVSAPPPPEPLARYLGLGGWYLRDANWWPDFPSTAAQVEQAWQRAGNQPVDGVIAFDIAAVRGLLRVLGRLEVPGLGTVDADTFEQVAAEQLYGADATASAAAFAAARASVLGPVGRALLQRLLAAAPAEVPLLAEEAGRLLDTKHLLLAFKDPRLSALARAQGWDGAMVSRPGDSLYIVDTTVSYGDTYTFIESAASLRVMVGAGRTLAHELRLEYVNTYPRGLLGWMPPSMVRGATFDPATARVIEAPGFWANWLRVYLPPGATVTSVDGLLDAPPPREELGQSLLEGYLPVPPGARRSVHLRYTTPAAAESVDEMRYRLFVHKQAGLECRRLTVEVTWPDGASATRRACPTVEGWLEVRR